MKSQSRMIRKTCIQLIGLRVSDAAALGGEVAAGSK